MNITGVNTLNELDTLELICTSSQPATLHWLKRSSTGDSVKKIIATSRITINFQSQAVGTEGESMAHSNLTIRSAVESDSGDYVCVANSDVNTLPTTVNHTVHINGRKHNDIVRI